MRYAGFWSRLWANLVDQALFAVPTYLVGWLEERSWLAALALPPLSFLLWEAYTVYCHGRWGQTVGKMVARIRIVTVDGEAISWRQAFLRSLVEVLLGMAATASTMVALFRMGPDEYLTLASPEDRWRRIVELAPLADGLGYAAIGWFWSEVVVLLSNERKRALHDFIAGTVVIHAPPGTLR